MYSVVYKCKEKVVCAYADVILLSYGARVSGEGIVFSVQNDVIL